jgi:hypothetical protein
MIGSVITLEPDRVLELLLSPVATPSPDEVRAFEHVGRIIARRSAESGLSLSAVFESEFVGRPWTLTERPAGDDELEVTLSFVRPHDTGEG